jgi:hypothetical protein
LLFPVASALLHGLHAFVLMRRHATFFAYKEMGDKCPRVKR